MILDDLEMCRRYLPVHPGFAAGFTALQNPELIARAPGIYELDGQRLKLIIGRDDGRGREGVQLEAHRRYIDIQLVVSGNEEMGWRPIASCQRVTKAYSEEGDATLFGDAIETWCRVPPGMFTIFFPEDAHAPLAGAGKLHKMVVKVAVDW